MPNPSAGCSSKRCLAARRHDVPRLWRARSGACRHRSVQRDRLQRRAAYARAGCSRGIGRPVRGCRPARGRRRPRTRRHRRRHRRRARVDRRPLGGAPAVRAVAPRSVRIRVRDCGAPRCGCAGQLSTGPSCRKGRSDGGPEVRMIDTLAQDLRYAVRTLARSPGFTLVAVLTLALGIGANTAIFSVFYGVLLRPLPYAEPDRLVGLAQTYPGGRGVKRVTYVQFQFLQRNNQVFESLAGSASVGFNFSTGSQTDRVYGLRVSKDYFRVLGVAPQLGRAFFADEDQPNGPSAVILSYGLWQRRFGGDSGVIGRTILLDGTPTTVAGVMPPDFRSPNGAEAWSTLAQAGRT